MRGVEGGVARVGRVGGGLGHRHCHVEGPFGGGGWVVVGFWRRGRGDGGGGREVVGGCCGVDGGVVRLRIFGRGGTGVGCWCGHYVVDVEGGGDTRGGPCRAKEKRWRFAVRVMSDAAAWE